MINDTVIVTSELMFELYSVPSLAYCVDSVMSFYENNQPAAGQCYAADGVVVSFNTASTSVIPILDGKGIMSSAKRYDHPCLSFQAVNS
jgi:actin-related protein 5